MSKTLRDLERAAIDAHVDGQCWADFWRQHGPHVIALEPHSRERFQRLYHGLLGLVVSGDTDGAEPIDATPPWERHDQPAPADVGTAARLQIVFPGFAEGVTG